VNYRGIDFEVEEASPSKWRWKIYQKIEVGPKIIGDSEYPSREAAIGACIRKISRCLKVQRESAAPPT
jgi:hypothetical protein